jgi:transposase-like protein
MHAKGRAGDCRNFGENHGRARLSDEQVAEIKALYQSRGYTQAELARMFSIGPSQISRIIQGQSRAIDR